MSRDEQVEAAWKLFMRAYDLQMAGEFEKAESCYRESIASFPTAEAHTFLGWTLRFQGRLEEAIAECQLAILVDPDFGNPYNDIGAYLIELGQEDDAIPWLEKALAAKRYETRHFPLFNLARVFALQEMYARSEQYLLKSLELEPGYEQAEELLSAVRRKVN